jgi:DNA-binding protein H-NS
MNDFVKEYLEKQRLEAEYERRTAHRAIKRDAANCNEYERYEEELEQ